MNGHKPKQSFDVLIIGAGISGINAAYRIQSECPGHTYAILEARDAIGGTWDLFRYPGIRSDSDLFTFGFSWHPWNQENPIAEGASIVKYMRESAALYGIDRHILFHRKVITANWSYADQHWTVTTDFQGETQVFTARFLIFGTGYYDYQQPLQAHIPGLQNFTGPVIHPQFWPEDLDYTDKKVVVIGSGATAVTLIPKLAEKAARATMLQRSPTYIMSLPNPTTKSWFGRLIPSIIYRKFKRLGWIYSARLFFLFCQRFPSAARWILRQRTSRMLPNHIPYDPHFNPRYNPWDQRLCICPDGDFFKSLHAGKADVKTDTIQTVTETGIQLDSGDSLEADIIVTATGLKLQLAGGASVQIDGRPLELSQKFMWNGVMVQDLPNAAYVIGYTNASWTLGADATALFVTRLLRFLEERRLAAVVPRVKEGLKLSPRRLLNLNSTYIAAAERDLPKAADQAPWQAKDHYFKDLRFARSGDLEDGLELIKKPSVKLRAKMY